MSESKELVLVTLPAAAELEAAFISDDYINRLISDIRQKATSVVGDVNTVKGRGVYISMASTVRRTKTVIDDAGKKLVAEMKKRPALVDASRKRFVTRLTNWLLKFVAQQLNGKKKRPVWMLKKLQKSS